jgi:hypothetical protein
MSADESDSQEPNGNTTAPSLKGRIADESDVGNDFSKGPPRSSTWADLDLSIIVAVVAPLVNWLTGSDQLKNLFLILFLVVYLHQLVQGMSQWPRIGSVGSLIFSKFPGNCTMLHDNGNLILRFAH